MLVAADEEKGVPSPKDGHFPETGSAGPGVQVLHPVVEDKLRRSLSPRQVQMIAIGGTIGYVFRTPSLLSTETCAVSRT